MNAAQSQVRYRVSARGNVTYEIDVWHNGLGRNRTVRGADQALVARMAQTQCADWNAAWATRQAKEAHRESLEEGKQEAAERTEEALQVQQELASILRHTLTLDDTVDFNSLKDASPFTEPPAKTPPRPTPPVVAPFTASVAPPEPQKDDPKYAPSLTLLDRLSPKRKQAKEQEAEAAYRADHFRWEQTKQHTAERNVAAQREHGERVKAAEAEHQRAVAAWEAAWRTARSDWEERRTAFQLAQAEQNAAIDTQRARYLQGAPDAVLAYCELVLSNSQYPEDIFPQTWQLDYNDATKSLVVDYALPSPDALPTLIEVKFSPTKGEFTEKNLTAAQAAKIYDDVLYQVALRTLHELFEADQARALDAITFNGYVHSIDRATGNEVDACVLSVHTKRDEFLAINLANVDPKACFKQLKGVGSAKLHSVTPVAPIMQMRRDDGRFVSAQEVAQHLHEGFNLAAMPWEDFEHLIRELFAAEFSVSGGEVKVTQASRDGGVDAVAFDPDPIRGGKIVIQAKRYTNTVDVSAVRDLYGTVLNEGATKGILVTTSDYGPDAYAFANGKPLTLLAGANLLHLLEKHGHRARIDIGEARKIAMEQRIK
jgi:restriction system protein